MLKLSWFNVANAQNDELSDEYRFGVRESKVHQTIKDSKSDIMCIMELRVCSTPDKSRKMMPEEIGIRMSQQTGMSIAMLRPQNLDHMAFWRMTLYNPAKVTPLQSFCRWSVPSIFGSQIVAERGVMLMFTQFSENKSQNRFWVINSHMPLALPEKLKTVAWLNDYAEQVCREAGDKSPIIFYGGDQNTFFDKKQDGSLSDGEQMMDLFDKKWVHLSKEAGMTFKSFPHDKFQGESVLDHILVNRSASAQVTKVGPATAGDTGASDHYLMSVIVQL